MTIHSHESQQPASIGSEAGPADVAGGRIGREPGPTRHLGERSAPAPGSEARRGLCWSTARLWPGLLGLALTGSPGLAQLGSTYCSGVPNSTGSAVTLVATGSLDVADDDVTLACAALPPSSVGYFLVARQRGSVPQVGGSQGDLCLGGPIGRYAGSPLVADAAGEVQLALHLASIPHPSQRFAVVQGDSLHFQYWYRDVLASGGATSNLSDARTLTFCPGPRFSGGLTATLMSPHTLSLVDVDADGDLDSVVSTSGTVDELHLNQGDGTFAPLLQIPAVGGTAHHALGDLDGDGHAELVAVSGGGRVTVRRGLGASGFGPAVSHPVPNAFDLGHLALGDLEGDGDVDVVVTGTHLLATLVNDGTGGLTTQAVPISVGVVSGLALGDLDADGQHDVVLSTGALVVLRGMPSGAWGGPSPHPAPPLTVDPTVIDVDRDGHLDVVAASLAGASIWYGDGVGALAPPVVLDMGTTPLSALEVGDIDLDGSDELIAAGLDRVSVRRGLGGRAYGPPTLYATGLAATGIAVGDVDGDTRMDLFILLGTNGVGGELCLLPGDGSGRFDVLPSTAVGPGPAALALFDLDRDGRLDVVTANEQSSDTSILLGLGDGAFAPRIDVPVGGSPVGVAVGDLDGDQRPDIIVANAATPGLTWLSNAGQGAFVPGGTLPGNTSARDVALGDLDGDGDLDVLATHTGQSRLSAHLNLGAGSFAAPTFVSVGLSPSDIAVGDLDADGDLDAVVGSQSPGSAEVRVLWNDGQGTFTGSSLLATGEMPTGVIVADLDGDGDADIATANFGTYDVSVLLQTGPGTFAAEVRYPAAADIRSMACADIEGDGDIDLVAASWLGVSVAVFENDGLAGFGAVARLASRRGMSGVALGDMDRDGDVDVIAVGRAPFFVTAPGSIVVTRNRCR